MQDRHNNLRNSVTDRIVGAVTPARVGVLERVDAAVAEALKGRSHRFHGWALDPLLVAPGGTGDGYVVALRAVPVRSNVQPFPWDDLRAIAARILENALHVRAVVPDVTTSAPVLDAALTA